MHVSNLFGTELGWQVACTLDRLLGSGQPGWPAEGTRGQVFFANSGAEANECALKLARKFGGRGRHVVVSAFGSFHGRTLATLHATGQPAKHEAFQPLPEGFRHVAWHDLEALEAALDPSVAAVLLEPVQGEGGVNPATAEYFQASAGSATSAGSSSWSTRCRPGSAAAAPGSVTSGSAWCPTWSPWPRRWATACPSVRAGPRQRWRPPSSRGTTPPPTEASPSPLPPPARCSR